MTGRSETENKRGNKILHKDVYVQIQCKL